MQRAADCPQLVALINRDYAEFVRLSSKLAGVDELVNRMRPPLVALRGKLADVTAAIVRAAARRCTLPLHLMQQHTHARAGGGGGDAGLAAGRATRD